LISRGVERVARTKLRVLIFRTLEGIRGVERRGKRRAGAGILACGPPER